MSGASRQRASAAERNRLSRRRKKLGIVRIVLFAERDWLAEMLASAGGFCHADEDDREAAAASLAYGAFRHRLR